MKIDRVFYNTIGSWYDDPIYMVFPSNDSTDSVTVYTLEDRAELSGVRGYYENEEILELLNYLRSVPFHDRIEMLKNFEKSKATITKYNL